MGEELKRRLMKSFSVTTTAELDKKLGIKYTDSKTYKYPIEKRLQEAFEKDPIRDLAKELFVSEGLNENSVSILLKGKNISDIAKMRLLNYLREIEKNNLAS